MSHKIALIGYSGFVGGNLAKQVSFDDGYNSQNIEEIEGKKYDLIISAGTKAEVWKANQDPKSDWQGIKKLLGSLKQVEAKHFVLISSVLCYPNPINVNEDTKIKLSEFSTPYGKNRYKMELFVKKHFPKVTIVRLPHLFGIGLKKNFVYDLIYDNALTFTHKDTMFQWYNLKNLWKDIQIAIKNNIDLVNFASEPTTAKELADLARPDLHFANVTEKPPLKFDYQTKYGKFYGSKNNYIYHKDKIFKELKSFIEKVRKDRLKVAISNLSWEVSEDKQVLELLKKYHIKGIEIAPTKIWPDIKKATVKNIKEYRKFWNDNEIEIVSITSLLFGHPELVIFGSKKTRDKTLDYLVKMARIGNLLGAKVMVFGSPKNRLRENLKKQEAQKIAIDFFQKLSKKIKKYNINFCVEPLGKTYSCDFIVNVKEAIKLIKDVNHPNFRSHIDIGSIEGNGEDYKKALELAKPYMAHFHISEPLLKPVPAGEVNHKKAAKILKNLNYQNFCCIEMPLAKETEHLYTIEKALQFATKIYG